jgi:hypothetical protein
MGQHKQEQQTATIDRILKIVPLPALIGIILGAIGGYIYYIEVGCATGTCPLTSNPYGSILYGALIGYLFGDMFRKKKKAAEQINEKEEG